MSNKFFFSAYLDCSGTILVMKSSINKNAFILVNKDEAVWFPLVKRVLVFVCRWRTEWTKDSPGADGGDEGLQEAAPVLPSQERSHHQEVLHRGTSEQQENGWQVLHPQSQLYDVIHFQASVCCYLLPPEFEWLCSQGRVAQANNKNIKQMLNSGTLSVPDE